MRIAATAAVLGIAAAVAVVTLRAPTDPASGLPARPAAAPSVPGAPPTPIAEVSPVDRRRPATAGGGAILASVVQAQAVVVGIVSEVASVDVHGWRAALRVDRVLLGSVRLGETLTIAWEELSATRQVRFTDDQRVLVVLDPLPTQSLWRKRFPARDAARPVMVVAAGGAAFLPRPDGLTLDVLEHYLAMASDARAGGPGAARLAELVRGGDPAVAREALGLLASEPTRLDGLDRLDADGAATLLAAARSTEREPSLRGAVLRLAASHRLPGTRETALALTEPLSPIRPDAYRALAALPGGLAPDVDDRLLADADPELRAVGIELVGDRVPRVRLLALLHDDPAPRVRRAAGQALLAREGSAGIGDVIALLDDPDAGVRSGIAESIGALGAPAVAPLRAVVDGPSERAALAAILGLSQTGREGGVILAAIADTHQNQAVRTFARLALGKAPGHTH